MHDALARLGVPGDATVLEPGCGTGNFMALAPEGMRFIGVELDGISGRIARALHPAADIRIENFRDTQAARGPHRRRDRQPALRRRQARLPRPAAAAPRFLLRQVGRRPEARRHPRPGHQPFHAGQAERRHPRVSRPSGRTSWARSACPPMPSSAKGTTVVTDIVFLRKRGPGEPAHHADPAWLETAPVAIEGRADPDQPLFPEPSRDGARHLEPPGHGSTTPATASLSTGDLADQLRARPSPGCPRPCRVPGSCPPQRRSRPSPPSRPRR